MIDVLVAGILSSSKLEVDKLPIPEPQMVAGCTNATWYNTGTTTANGESFNPRALTAAHGSLPMGTWVTLTNPVNRRSVSVRINDRKPSSGYDLTPAAFSQLSDLDNGVITVCAGY